MLTVCFIVFIFAIGALGLPTAMITIGTHVKEDPLNFPSLIEKLKEDYTEIMPFAGPPPINRGHYIDLNGFIANAIGQRFMNDRVKLDNGNLAYLGSDKEEGYPVNALAIAENLSKLCQVQQERGGEFLFVLAPMQAPKYEQEIIPAGYTDYNTPQADALMEAIEAMNIPSMDLRTLLHEQGITQKEAFFVTDHHWRPETGFWAFGEMLSYFENTGAITELDHSLLDIENYDVKTYEDYFLGSAAIRTGPYYAGIDDFSIITPKFETHMTVDIPSKDFHREGSFSETAYSDTHMGNTTFYTAFPYEKYGHSDKGLIQYRNENAPIKKKIMTIGDSFTNTSTTFFPLCVQSCDELDMRFYTQDFTEHFEEYNPDILIVMITASTLVQENTLYPFVVEK